MQLQNEKFQRLQINEEALGEGAEGTVYEVIAPEAYLGYVVKIYKNPKHAQQIQEKIQYLITNQPKLKEANSIIFPKEVVYDHGTFAGFLMKKAKGQYDLTTLCTLKPSSRIPQSWREKFDRQNSEGMRNRMAVCYNVAAAINELHRTRKFTFIDIKPENIKVSFDGKVSVVDIDSIAISDGFELLFPAEKFTQEYSPVEFKNLNLKADLIDETWDRFSISVIFYKILFGIHPYAGTCKGDYAALNSNEQKMIEGLFPNGKKKEHFDVIPEPHQKFKEAPRKIRNLFLNTFEEGLYLPTSRASAEDWCKVFKTAKPSFFERMNTKMKAFFKKEKETKEQATTEIAYTQEKEPNPSAGLAPALIIFAFFAVIAFYLVKVNDARVLRELDASFGEVIEKEPTQFVQKIKLYEGHDAVEEVYEDVSWVRIKDKFALATLDREYLTELKYDWANDFESGLSAVRFNGKYGFVNRYGEEVIPLEYDYVTNFKGDVAIARKNKVYYFISRQGVVLKGYQEVGDFYQGIATFKKDGLWGYLNEQGDVIASAQFDYAYPFVEGRAKVNHIGKYGYIDSDGKMVIPAKYDNAGAFRHGKSTVSIGNDEFMIDIWGKIINE
jgi:serine/threonine protein kinase